ncbi:hypothetical protein HX126_04780 [Chryseobacterium indologenes]|uniref:hypothetical protein n=1 Tax=Chryseobacterium indologenes TaxID=253 RepID=UPI0025749C9C|nr:hypothetical protein [Chryseobacterium indologenes]MDM1553875.1 hypothetical protein [Chryseobacterium indologenes]
MSFRNAYKKFIVKINIFLSLISIGLNAQLQLNIKELNYDPDSELIPKHYSAKSKEKEYKGFLLEINIRNDSNYPVTLPLDTLSHGMPFTEDLKEYFTSGNGLFSMPDQNHLVGVYGFIHQSGKFIEYDRADDPFYDYKGFEDKAKIMKQREEEIEKWNKSNGIKAFKNDRMNWYLAKSMVIIAPGEEIRYKMFFNPFLKMPYWYSSRDYYYNLNADLPYTLTFKIICTKNLYKHLDLKQKKKYDNLFVGIVESNTLTLTTKHN